MASQTNTPPYTQAEKAWLKKHHGDGFHFLRTYGYSIYDKEQRAEGRRIVRAFVEDDQLEELEETPVADSDKSLRDLEEDLSSHLAEHHFSAEQLGFIKKHYSHSSNFLLSYGLKPFDEEDCQESRAILTELMRKDRDGEKKSIMGCGVSKIECELALRSLLIDLADTYSVCNLLDGQRSLA